MTKKSSDGISARTAPSWRTALDAEVEEQVRQHAIGVKIAEISAALRDATRRQDAAEIARLSAERTALLRKRAR